MADTNLVLGGKERSSRLVVGTGKYGSMELMKQAHEASGAQIITVALRRVSLPSGGSILDHLDTTRYTLLPNTAGCYRAGEAIRTSDRAREAGLGEMVKLEVIGDSRTLFPDVEGLLEATRKLARDGFTVMPYTNDDPVIARKLEDAGAACVMPLAAPIGSGLGIRNPYNIKIILESVSVPVIVDAGVGTASDAAIAMELGCEGVLMNTAIAGARAAGRAGEGEGPERRSAGLALPPHPRPHARHPGAPDRERPRRCGAGGRRRRRAAHRHVAAGRRHPRDRRQAAPDRRLGPLAPGRPPGGARGRRLARFRPGLRHP